MFKSGLNIIKDIDTVKRQVVFAFSKFDDYDSDGDVTVKGAFKKNHYGIWSERQQTYPSCVEP